MNNFETNKTHRDDDFRVSSLNTKSFYHGLICADVSFGSNSKASKGLNINKFMSS